MRIAFYHNLPTGGALRVTLRQLSELCKSHRIDCFKLSSASDASQVLDRYCAHTKVYDYELQAPKRPGKLQPVAWLADLRRMKSVHRKIASDINSDGYDLCLTVTCPFFELPFLHCQLSVPSVYICHSSTYPSIVNLRSGKQEVIEVSRNPLDKRFQRELASAKQQSAQRASVIVANSLFSREELIRLYGVNSRLLYPGVDTEWFYPEPDVDIARFALGVGALAPFKAHDLSVRAIAKIPQAIRPELGIAYHTEVSGEREYLIGLADSLGVTLRLMPRVSVDTLRELYNRASVTLFPSVFEPLGLVPLESMACGTPVVGIAEGGTRETVLSGVTGLLTQRSAVDFAEAISDLLEHPSKAKEMGEAGLSAVRDNWTWDKSVASLESLLAKVASGSYE